MTGHIEQEHLHKMSTQIYIPFGLFPQISLPVHICTCDRLNYLNNIEATHTHMNIYIREKKTDRELPSPSETYSVKSSKILFLYMRNVQNPFTFLESKGNCFRKNLGENQKDFPALLFSKAISKCWSCHGRLSWEGRYEYGPTL